MVSTSSALQGASDFHLRPEQRWAGHFSIGCAFLMALAPSEQAAQEPQPLRERDADPILAFAASV
jgi:hypothetical protein